MSNYVVRDVVHYVDSERMYRPRRSFSRTLANLRRKLWMLVVILGLSGGMGYLAVYLPGFLDEQRENFDPLGAFGGEDMVELRKKYDGLSKEEKDEIAKRFGVSVE